MTPRGFCLDRTGTVYNSRTFDDLSKEDCLRTCGELPGSTANPNNAFLLAGVSHNDSNRRCDCEIYDRDSGRDNGRSKVTQVEVEATEWKCYRNLQFEGVYTVPPDETVHSTGATPTTISVLSNDILDRDTSTEGSANLRVDSVTTQPTPNRGICAVASDRKSITYTINDASFSGDVTCQYRARILGNTDTVTPFETVTITVRPSRAVTANNDERTYTRTTANPFTREIDVLSNDVINNGAGTRGELRIFSVDSEGGSFCSARADQRSLVYSDSDNFIGTRRCTYRARLVRNGSVVPNSESAVATVTINISPTGTGTLVVAVRDTYPFQRTQIGGVEISTFPVLENDELYLNSNTAIINDPRLRVVNVEGAGCSASDDRRQLRYISGNGFIGDVTCSYQTQYVGTVVSDMDDGKGQRPGRGEGRELQRDSNGLSNRATVSIQVLPPNTVCS